MLSLFLLPCFGLLALSTPTPPEAEATACTVSLVKQTKAPPLDGPAQKRKVFNRMGWTMPESSTDLESGTQFDLHMHALLGSAASAADPVVSGRVYATPEAYQSEYLVPIKIGTPAQELMLNFDTGSSDLWIFSRYLNATTVGQHTPFNERLSKTFKNDTQDTWAIKYADNSGASGVVGYDTVNVGGVSQTRQAIELATAVSSQFTSDTNSDGLFGLGFDNINTIRPKQQQTWFQHVKHALPKRVFSVNLREDGSGFYEFGRITPGAYKGNLTRVPTSMQNGYWEFESPAFAINGSQVYNFNSPSPGIAGEQLFIMPLCPSWDGSLFESCTNTSQTRAQPS